MHLASTNTVHKASGSMGASPQLLIYRDITSENGSTLLNHRHIAYVNPAFDPDIANEKGDLQTISQSLQTEQESAPPNEGNKCWRKLRATWLCEALRPLTPSRVRVARLAVLWLLGLAAWASTFLLLGEDAAPPAGQLWRLIMLSVVAKLGGWVSIQFRLPGLLGMLLAGIALQSAGLVSIGGPYLGLVRVIRKMSLVIIMMRAGLDLDPGATRRLCGVILRLGTLPWLMETSCVAVMAHLLLNMPWTWAFLLGAVESAVSPAVVVPSLIVLRSKGYGVAKGVPTLVLAVTGIEDAVSISIFGVISSVMFSTGSLTFSIIQGPASVAIGVASGIVIGLLSRFIPDKSDPYVISIRVFFLLLGGLLAVLGSDRLGFGGAGPLAVITAAFVAGSAWVNQGWKVGENQVALTFGVLWQFFEPVVFGLVGAQIRVSELPSHTVGLATACVLGPALVRFTFTLLLLYGSVLNLKEKFFVALAWMAKATVQAVLGPAALDLVRGSTNAADVENAQLMFIVCVIAILLTAPVGAVLIAGSGPRLLQKVILASSSSPHSQNPR